MSKILIVDDAAFMRSVIKGILETGGFTDTCEADDGDTAMEVFNAEKPDLTILDIT
ncbi:MAG: response regulator, partial [Synergistaceae bacterium]|nr:response regulator [Synergistaceae bacterium]